MAEKSNILKKWIDLKDPYGAKLKFGRYNNKLVLVLTGVRPRSRNFQKAIEELGFIASSTGAFLVKAVELSDRILPSMFQPIWPQASISLMPPSSYILDFSSVKERLQKRAEQRANAKNAEEIDAERRDIQESVSDLLNRSSYLGRNAEGLKVFGSVTGRFVIDNNDVITHEDANKPSPAFLRSTTQSDVRECAKGLLRAAEQGESQNLNKLLAFAGTVLQKEVENLTLDEREMIAQAIDSAILESLVENNETAGKAWADAAYYQEMMPGRAELSPDSVSTPYLPAPIAVQVQRFLTSARAVNVNGKIPGFGFGMLPDSTRVFVEDPDTMEWGSQTYHRPMVEYAAQQDIPADGGYWRISGSPSDEDFEEFFGSLSEDATVIVTAGELDHLPKLESHAHLIQSIKIPSWLSRTTKPIFMFVMKKGDRPQTMKVPSEATPITHWDDLKMVVDETLLRMGKEAEANEKINLKSERTENQLQRPYLAASRIGEASTMVPRNLQSALGFALSRLQENNGPIDDFVSAELGIGPETLASRLSPEQVDAVGLAIDRIYSGRGFILGDETGIGKGRTIASLAAWAERQNKRIVFVTDRANLFSDLARDLIDIGEWERFRPLITNADGKIFNMMQDGEEIASPPTPAELRKAMETDPSELPSNIIFTTYSQLAGEGSDKAKWLNELSKDSMLILDEAHIAAGADSNTAKQVAQMVENAWGVIYSSATWAKSSKNLHIFSRAMPESVNITQVVSAMKSEGEAFGEVFSSMLAMDGALIRREHDLSKVDFIVDVDNVYTERNKQIAGQVAEILGMMAMISGEINHMLHRMSTDTRTALLEAQKARQNIRSATENQAATIAEKKRTLEWLLTQRTALIRQWYERQGVSVPENPEPPALREHEHLKNLYDHLRSVGPLTADEAREINLIHAEMQLVDNASQIDTIRNDLTSLGADSMNERERIAPTKLFSSSFGTGGAIYQVMRRTLAALSVDYTADQAVKAAQSGIKPVIVVEETGESFVRQLINDEIHRIQEDIRQMRKRQERGELTPADETTLEIAELLDTGVRPSDVVKQIRAPNLQDMLRQLVTRLGGVRIYEITPSVDDAQEGLITTTAFSSLTDVPGISPELIQKYLDGIEKLTDKINALPALPIVPFDALRLKMEKAGLRVGEISGRTYALKPIDENQDDLSGTLELIKRARKKSDVTQTAARFNSGDLDALILNQAAATGMSLHSSPRFADQSQRQLFEMQSSENPTTRIQLFGRVNRFDQVVPPRISFMNTGLKSEIRSMIMSNLKLKQLSANVRASQDNAAIIEDVPDLLNPTGDKVCQEFLLENPGIASRLDIQMARIKETHGLANTVTQRLALLSLDEYERVYSGLCEAYEDAVMADKLAMTGNSITTYDWRAKMLKQRHAWGPTQHIEALSAFDSPVFERVVEFVEDYQPLHWHQVRDRIAESTQRLIEDDRIRQQHILSVAPDHATVPVFDSQLRLEERMTDDERHHFWASKVMESMVMSLPKEALQDGDVDVESLRPIDTPDEEDENQERLNLDQPGLRLVPKGFEAIAGHWVAVEARIPGTRITQRMMALVSRSGKSAKMWFLNEKGEARQFLIDLDGAIKGDHAKMGNAFKELEKVKGITEQSWQRQRFNRVWGSIDPDIHLLDITEPVNKAMRMLESKKIMGLQQTGHSSIEEALSDANHNAVKEAHFRSMFFENVVSRLVPGVEFILKDKEKKSARWVNFFNDNRMVVLDVVIPPSPHEGSLSKWKFHMAMPGHEDPIILSGATLFKLAGDPPKFRNVVIGHNLFEGIGFDMEMTARIFNSFKKGERTRRKTLLVGNMFQAGEWARASKRGRPILYTDESGQVHRAIEVISNGFSKEEVNFPLRLHGRNMIKDFFSQVMHPNAPEPHNGVTVFTSFRGALDAQREGNSNTQMIDHMVISKRANAISWSIDKEERERVRRAIRAAVKADQARWEQENPGVPYPVQYSTHVPRTSHGQQTSFTIKLPDTPIGRDRFIDLLVKSQGLEIFALRTDALAYHAATEAERRHYERLAQPALTEQARKRKALERRQATQAMIENAFGKSRKPQAIEGSDPTLFASEDSSTDANRHIEESAEPGPTPDPLSTGNNEMESEGSSQPRAVLDLTEEERPAVQLSPSIR